ncbi:MAG: hypothetical protein IPJ86_17490 [Bacteroidetes bacterium]|nr:hypothetical protein [Bacteroidota bacterium]
MPFNKYILPLAAILLFHSCKTSKNTGTEVRNLPEITVVPGEEYIPQYMGSYPKTYDLLHTALDVRFDWTKRYFDRKGNAHLAPSFLPRRLCMVKCTRDGYK